MNNESISVLPPLSKFVDIAYAAQYLGLSKSTIYQKVSSGDLISYKSGKYLRFLVEDLDNFILSTKRSN